ncbi:hypothetical protein [Streptomyces blattellae]|uniref:hypothetical protein n=1 Tax=Streptomyces blattellae TaxID=2569855 RepID=UPI0012B833F2|nr:hypothetical protein [Streptomyces blattellae]
MISTVTTPGSAKLAVAGLAGATEGAAESGVLPLELPSGLGYLSEEKRTMAVPGRRPGIDGGDSPMEAIWQATVAGPGSEVIMIQMVTPAMELADAYRNILLGVAHTFSFTDPNKSNSPDERPEPGSAAAAMRSDFG